MQACLGDRGWVGDSYSRWPNPNDITYRLFSTQSDLVQSLGPCDGAGIDWNTSRVIVVTGGCGITSSVAQGPELFVTVGVCPGIGPAPGYSPPTVHVYVVPKEIESARFEVVDTRTPEQRMKEMLAPAPPQ